MGNTSKALFYYEKYTDDLVETRDEKIANLETEAVIKYETGKKDEAIAHQKMELKRKSTTQRIYIGIVALLGSLLTGLLFLFRKKKKITADLELKNRENEVLMKEIHHRVKNNLQILSSLLSLQSDNEEDQTIVGALQESRSRVESMGLIHQKLYTRDNLTAIKMEEYVKELCDHLVETYSSNEKTVTIDSSVEVNLADVETAIPLGLIINELITNSMKYAFEENRRGAIQVHLWEEGTELKLVVSDNGQTIKEKEVSASSTKFGTRLIKILSKKLKGKIEVSREQGYKTSITFQRYTLS
ncbi:MAG: two-component sensor histidine kinase [Saprospiraceae bacterium]